MAVLTLAVFLRCGRSLIGAIDKSLQQQREQQQLRGALVGNLTCDTTEGTQSSLSLKKVFSKGLGFRGGTPTLVAARSKVKRMLVLTTLLVIPSTSIGVYAGFSSDMAEAALILDVLLTWLPMAWLSINMQLHAGRSQQRVAPRLLPSQSNGRLFSPRSILLSGRWNPFSHQQVVPTEPPC